VNQQQRTVLIAALVAVAVLGLIPPWRTEIRMPVGGTYEKALGHHLLFLPPASGHQMTSGKRGEFVHVDYGRLFLYWAGVGGCAGSVYLVLAGMGSRPATTTRSFAEVDAPPRREE